MCLFTKTVTVEKIVEVEKVVDPQPTVENITRLLAAAAKGMTTDDEMCKFWYEIDKAAFAELGEVALTLTQASAEQIQSVMAATYPTLNDFKFPDNTYDLPDKAGLLKLLKRDWVYRVKYISEKHDCDDFALSLAYHTMHYYEVTSVFIVWGTASGGSHAYNLAFYTEDGVIKASLIEPQSGVLFDKIGPIGEYIPQSLVLSYGTIKENNG